MCYCLTLIMKNTVKSCPHTFMHHGSFIVANSRLVTLNYMQYSMASVTNANNTLSAFTTPPFSFCAGLSCA